MPLPWPHSSSQAAASADPTVGGTTVGNVLNPAGVNSQTADKWMDDDGMGTRAPSARSPAGPPYAIPLDPGDTDLKKGVGWITQGFIEAGGITTFGNDKNAGFLNYKDPTTGAYVNGFGFMGDKPDEARYYEATGGAVGMDDQFYRVKFGRYNDWKVTAFYDSVPRVYTSNYRSLWSGVGTSNLTLDTFTGHTRHDARLGPRGDPQDCGRARGQEAHRRMEPLCQPSRTRAARARSHSQRSSAAGGGGGNIDVPQSVDYSTYDLLAGASYADALSSLNIRASASFFRNHIDTMTFQNPLYVTLNGSSGLSPTSFTTGRYDLAPDNEAYNVKAEYARSIPDFYRSKFTATLAVGTMRQNANLIPSSEYSLAGGTTSPGGVSLANVWNTPEGLSRQSAEARIDTLLADVGLVMKPVKDLDVRGKNAVLRDAQRPRLSIVQSAHRPVGTPAERRQRNIARHGEYTPGRESSRHIQQRVQHRGLQPRQCAGHEPRALRGQRAPSRASPTTTSSSPRRSPRTIAWAARRR